MSNVVEGRCDYTYISTKKCETVPPTHKCCQPDHNLLFMQSICKAAGLDVPRGLLAPDWHWDVSGTAADSCGSNGSGVIGKFVSSFK